MTRRGPGSPATSPSWGVTLFTAASALGLAATGAAVEWVAAGAEPTGPKYAVAAALNHADDAVWFLSIVAYWGAPALYGRVNGSPNVALWGSRSPLLRPITTEREDGARRVASVYPGEG